MRPTALCPCGRDRSAPDTVRVVLIRNNTWRFLMPARRPSGITRAEGGGDGAWTSTAANLAAGDAAGDSVGRSGATDSSSGSSSRTSSSSSSSRQGAAVGRRYPWPRLVPEPLGECASPCHGQVSAWPQPPPPPPACMHACMHATQPMQVLETTRVTEHTGRKRACACR